MVSSTENSSSPTRSSELNEGGTNRGPFVLMTVLFFLWGFMTVWNDILIPRFKEAFDLSYFQAMLVQFAFFGAYAIGSLIYFVISTTSGDPINRIGYKNGVIVGLLIAAAGSLLFYPAASFASYPLFLVALFVVGLGFTMLQITANPYITILGPERTASSRLNLSQAFNSIGTTIGPIAGGWLIFQVFSSPDAHGADSVKIPYLCFAGVFAIIAVLFRLANLPSFANEKQLSGGLEVLKHPHTVLGMLAIFMYVGAEVAVGSVLINFLGDEQVAGLSSEAASQYLAYYWGGLMVGRFMGAFALSDMQPKLKRILVITTPIIAFLVVAFLSDTYHASRYGILLLILLIAFQLGAASPHRMLALFGLINAALLAVGILSTGEAAQWSVLGVGLFCSIMWSNIFSLAIEGLGPLKSQASSLLVMAILGGALLPPLQGLLADRVNVQFSFVVPAVAFLYVFFYGMLGYRLRRTGLTTG